MMSGRTHQAETEFPFSRGFERFERPAHRPPGMVNNSRKGGGIRIKIVRLLQPRAVTRIVRSEDLRFRDRRRVRPRESNLILMAQPLDRFDDSLGSFRMSRANVLDAAGIIYYFHECYSQLRRRRSVAKLPTARPFDNQFPFPGCKNAHFPPNQTPSMLFPVGPRRLGSGVLWS